MAAATRRHTSPTAGSRSATGADSLLVHKIRRYGRPQGTRRLSVEARWTGRSGAPWSGLARPRGDRSCMSARSTWLRCVLRFV